ncbi:MAG TPA: hypothetical protein VM848_06275 [Acidimicrobiia bacterium]|nr:hypothetical protein [Acidimicrobiia bacterium]
MRPTQGVEYPHIGDRADFLDWFNTTWRAAEDDLRDGDAGPRSTTWSERRPVTLFGLWFDLVAAHVSGDLADTVHREITSSRSARA